MSTGLQAEYNADINMVIKELNRLPRELHDEVLRKAAKNAASIIVTRSKANLLRHAVGSEDGFSKARFIARNIRASMIPMGVRVHVKGPDVPMSKGKYYNIEGAAKLYGAGAYKTPNRKGKGPFRGFGNYIANAYESHRPIINRVYRRDIIREVDRVERRLFRGGIRRASA